MSFTGRIRLYLVATALLPPLMMMSVVYFFSANQAEITYRNYAAEDLRKLITFRGQFREQLSSKLARITDHSWFDRSVRLARRGRNSQIAFDDLQGFGLDFCELLDPQGRVVASAHRPGLIGESIPVGETADEVGAHLFEAVQFDVEGRHAALAGVAVDTSGFSVLGGYYLDRSFVATADQIMRGNLSIKFLQADDDNTRPYLSMTLGSLYDHNGGLESALTGGTEAGFVLVADFERPDQSGVFASFIDVISIVALVSILAAVGLGMYMSHRARREFDNLIEAFDRVAAGDLSTVVMAYTEGEFSHLADSFSEMTRKLRQSQIQLATTEKIAAWQVMARKIAHEVKNPLTPIAVCADDLRRSYQDKLPGFEQTLDHNTRMIRNEINRLTRLLDEFVSFARMKPSEIVKVHPDTVLSELAGLYQIEISTGRLTLANQVTRTTVRIDPEQTVQLLVNLIKNSLESGDNTSVTVSLVDDKTDLRLTVTDDGPGFSAEVVKRKFEPYLSTKKDGSGLGLVICQRIVHDHGGTIDLANRAEGGAEVTIVFPQS